MCIVYHYNSSVFVLYHFGDQLSIRYYHSVHYSIDMCTCSWLKKKNPPPPCDFSKPVTQTKLLYLWPKLKDRMNSIFDISCNTLLLMILTMACITYIVCITSFQIVFICYSHCHKGHILDMLFSLLFKWWLWCISTLIFIINLIKSN